MIRRFALAGVATAAVALLGGAHPARAQVPPTPEQTAPVLELIAPVASPACGNAVLAVALVPGVVAGQTGGALPIELVLPAFGPVFVVCGAVPAPPARLRCDADRSLNETANAVAAAAGTPLPVGVDPVGNAVEQTIVLQDTLPPPANTTDARGQIVTTLNCTPIAAPAEHSEPPSESAPSDDESFDDPILREDFTLAPLFDALTPDVAANTERSSIGAAPVAPASHIGGAGFAYPVVFALPLVFLVVGGYLGRSLTQPVGASQRASSRLVSATTHDDAALAKVEA